MGVRGLYACTHGDDDCYVRRIDLAASRGLNTTRHVGVALIWPACHTKPLRILIGMQRAILPTKNMNSAANMKSDKAQATKLRAYYERYFTARAALPNIGISMFNVPGIGVAVECTATGNQLAHFSAYDAASRAVSACDRALRDRVRASRDSI